MKYIHFRTLFFVLLIALSTAPYGALAGDGPHTVEITGDPHVWQREHAKALDPVYDGASGRDASGDLMGFYFDQGVDQLSFRVSLYRAPKTPNSTPLLTEGVRLLVLMDYRAGGTRGLVATTEDGIDWAVQDLPGTWFEDVAWTGRHFVAPSHGYFSDVGELLTSRDGIDWRREPMGFGMKGTHIEGNGVELIVAGRGGLLRAVHVFAVPRHGGPRHAPGGVGRVAPDDSEQDHQN